MKASSSSERFTPSRLPAVSAWISSQVSSCVPPRRSSGVPPTSQAARAAYYKPDGSSYAAGEIMRQPNLAWTLTQIAERGADGFYKGPVAERFAADMRAHGGIITAADLAAYRPVERKALHGSYRGLDVVTAPPASAGGATLLNMLNILENFDLRASGAGSARSLHLMAETMKLAYADRYKVLGDTDFVTVPIQGFISKPYGQLRARQIDPDKAQPAKTLGAGDPMRCPRRRPFRRSPGSPIWRWRARCSWSPSSRARWCRRGRRWRGSRRSAC
eukprot:gene7959-10772_t